MPSHSKNKLANILTSGDNPLPHKRAERVARLMGDLQWLVMNPKAYPDWADRVLSRQAEVVAAVLGVSANRVDRHALIEDKKVMEAFRGQQWFWYNPEATVDQRAAEVSYARRLVDTVRKSDKDFLEAPAFQRTRQKESMGRRRARSF